MGEWRGSRYVFVWFNHGSEWSPLQYEELDERKTLVIFKNPVFVPLVLASPIQSGRLALKVSNEVEAARTLGPTSER